MNGIIYVEVPNDVEPPKIIYPDGCVIHMTDIERLLILNMIEDVGSIRTQNLLKYFSSLDKIFEAGKDELKRVEDIGPIIAERIIEGINKIDIKDEIQLIKENAIKVITFLDEDYPKNLKNIHSPPMVLYVKGKILPEDDIAVAVVGSRLASFYGLSTAERLGFELASRGITIVSGLAKGIDSSAHRGALKAKGRTIAVLGSGLLNIYPEEHNNLANDISKNGAVISEFPIRTIPDKGNFPKRNRIISGLSLGVVVVEAGERSGALITADLAMEEGRDVFAIPGKVDSYNSKGTNRLIKQGAKLVESSEDILEELNLERYFPLSNNRSLDKEEVLVYNLLSSEPKHIDELSKEGNIAVSEVLRLLLSLEMKRFVRSLPGKNFVRL